MLTFFAGCFRPGIRQFLADDVLKVILLCTSSCVYVHSVFLFIVYVHTRTVLELIRVKFQKENSSVTYM